MDLNLMLKKKLICFTNLRKKSENLNQLIQLIVKENKVESAEIIKETIFNREKLMSTGIGLGIAIPHVRIKGVENIIIAIGINKGGIEDYESLDGTPVKIVIMIIAGEKQHEEYLLLLAQIVKILKRDSMRTRLLETDKSEDVIRLLVENFNNHQ